MKGRPLWFIAAVLGGWAAARTSSLWQGTPDAAALPRAVLAAAPERAAVVKIAAEPAVIGTRNAAGQERTSVRGHVAASQVKSVAEWIVAAPIPARPVMEAQLAPIDVTPRLVASLVAPAPAPAHASRFGGSFWSVVREGSGATPGAQLGGTQAGFRVSYALDGARRLALTARVTTPARGIGREAALGFEWRPFDAPVRLIAEQRIALDEGRGGPSLLVVTGLPPTPVAGLSIEAYAQAGAVARDRIEGFADGAARLTRAIGALDIGVGAWGGAQRGAERVDVGPTIGLRLPTRLPIRVTLDWRARIAGRARPGSGPALSIGGDF